jgi:hypothetical protein
LVLKLRERWFQTETGMRRVKSHYQENVGISQL